MTIARRPSARVLLGTMSAAALMALYAGCASSDVNTNREGGGPLPPIPEAGTSEASPSDAPVPWCAAYHIINCVCQQCHQNPPLHGAPIPLMTYEDTQAPFPTSTSPVWQTMQTVVSTRFMPYTADKTIMPTVLPLDSDDYDTLLSWLGQGATPLGGTDCPMDCDWSKGPPPGR